MFFLWRPVFTIVGLVFLIAGIGLAIFVGAYLVNDYDKALNGERAEAVVLQARDGTKPILEFRTRRGEPIRIEGKISSSPSPYDVGERVSVFYDPADPADALIDTFIERWFLPLLFGGFGTVFLLVGGTMVTLARRSSRKLARLQRDGRRFDGRIVAFEQNRFTKINGRRPWQVLVTWTDAQGVTHSIHSEMMREDPSQRFKIGDRATVIADPTISKLAWVDLFGQANTIGESVSASSGNFGKSTNNPVVRRR